MRVNGLFFSFTKRCYYPSRGSISLHESHAKPSSFFLFPLFLHPGQIQEVSLGQEEAASQVEVTPELDLEVVPESSGDWQNVFP